MRRKFTDTLKSLPKELRERSPAQVGLDYCDKLFHLESGFTEQKLSSQKRYQACLEQSRPLAEKFFAWAAAKYEKNPVPKSIFGAALTYAVSQKSWLVNVFLDGRLERSSNRAERAVRPFAVGRKNRIFSNTPKGTDASAAVYSIVETAKADCLRPYLYLKFLLERLSSGALAEDCLPWCEPVKNLCS
jgi:hypothetical protein